MTNPENILEGLDQEQRQAATALQGPVCILAGAGTGKTRAITHRIAYGVATGVYDPYKTLALTFTARAAAEMRSRLRDLGAHGVQARTFHAAALRQLQYFWPQVVGGPMPQLVENKIQLIIEAARRLKLSTDRAIVRDLAGEIEWAKVSMLTPETYPQHAVTREMPAGWDMRAVTRLFRAYEDLKTDRGLIDFEDVLLVMVGILDDEPKVAATIRNQYRTFIVDEYQDVSPLQQRLLDGWLGDRDDLCVVGDASQTIYSFTGATSDFLLDFRQKYPHAQHVKLVRDYRSTPQVVELANKVLGERTRQQASRKSMPRWPEPLELVSQKDPGPTPVFAECTDDEAEARWVADQISKEIARGVPASEIAVLFRTNGQSAVFEQELTARNISFMLRGAERFFSRKEVRDGILQLRAAARADQTLRGEPVVDRVKDVLGSLGYSSQAPQAAGAQREKWESLNALVNLVTDLVQTRGDQCTLTTVVQELDDRASYQHAPTMDGITLASLHSAKGLEWDVVFLVGLNEGLMPISFAEEQHDIDEERRLFYVGITRARYGLYFSWATARNPGRRSTRKPSRFLDSIRPDATHRGAGTASASRRQSKSRQKVKHCRNCEAPLTSGVERKLGRCEDCPASYDENLYESLREWRSETAQQSKVPAYVVFTDATLVAIAERLPQDLKTLRTLPGIGPSRIEKYGQAVLEIIKSAA